MDWSQSVKAAGQLRLPEFGNLAGRFEATEKMPLLFVGHGNPMLAITDNIYKQGWQELGRVLPHPKAILCISAHWLTRGTFVTMADPPRYLCTRSKAVPRSRYRNDGKSPRRP